MLINNLFSSLTEEEIDQFIHDLWECGIPPHSFQEWVNFYHKWKDKVELPKLNEDNYNLFKK
jgi:hypothetical protein